MKTSPRVISSYGVVTPEQLDMLRYQTARERNWYADTPSFEDNSDIERAVNAQQLVHVRSTANFRLIGRLCHRRTDVDQLAFTTPACLAMIHNLSDRWRTYANEAGVDDQIRLSLTSLVRTLSYQRALSGENTNTDGPPKLALPASESTHPKILGGAVDFDLSGYYSGFSDGIQSVRLSGPEQHGVIRAELIARLGETASPYLADPRSFNPDVPVCLKAAAEDMHNEYLVNRVIEFPGQANECMHVAVNPHNNAIVSM